MSAFRGADWVAMYPIAKGEKVIMAKRRSLMTMMVLCGVLFVCLSPSAIAKRSRKPEDVFKGDIVLSEKKFPRKFKSDKEFVKHMKKVDTKTFYANEKGEWRFRYMIFSKAPVGTMTAEISYYDITDGNAVKVNTFALYPRDEKDRIISGRAKLKPDGDFEPNKKYKMVFSRGYGHKPLASTEFILYPAKGSKPEEKSNTVDF